MIRGLNALTIHKKSQLSSRYIRFDRSEWAKLRASTPLPLSEQDLEMLHGINEHVSMDEVTEVYLPLSRLLHLYVDATQNLFSASSAFLGRTVGKVPYIIGIAGSVAVGKSTTARIIQSLLSKWPSHPKVDLITTDGFLFPNHILEERKLMHRKGFPESYDVRKLIRFLADVKSGKGHVEAPVYSHLSYDIIPDETIVVRHPDIMIVEGLNVLQTVRSGGEMMQLPHLYVSDFFDFSIYVDADEFNIRNWYIERFRALRNTAFRNENSYFHRYASLSDEEATQTASTIWEDINAVNLRQNILPTRMRAQLILEKTIDHSVQYINLRKL